MKHALAALLAGVCLLATSASVRAQNHFNEVDLVSDLSGRAAKTDTNLVNPWGLVPGPTGVFWVSNNGTSTSTLYQPDGTPVPLVVKLPGGDPTGVALANRTDLHFTFPSGDTMASAVFIFVNQPGHILAWSPTVDMTHAIDVAHKDGAQYTGVALASTASGPRLYAADFGAGTIDVFDHAFAPATTSGHFTDPNLPSDYAPFNVANIHGRIFVAFAEKSGGDEVHGAGLGIVDAFDTDGNFLRRVVSNGGALNAPWGMALAPDGFGDFGGDLLVGNLGDGRIDAFALSDGSPAGTLADASSNPISIPGLWGLSFGSLASGPVVAHRLYFAAGIEGEAHGLFGYLEVAGRVSPPPPGACANRSRGIGFWSKPCRSAHGDEQGDEDRGDDDHARGVVGAFDGGRDDGEDGGDHDHRPGAGPDSLPALLGCITSSSSAFGPNGCFTAGCELLSQRGMRGAKVRLAQEFLVLLLNHCAGFVCDTLAVRCGAAAEAGGDLDLTGVHTVGDVIALVDAHLCASDLSTADLRVLHDLLECALESGDDDDANDLDREVLSRAVVHGRLEVKTVSGNPLRTALGMETRLQLSSDAPQMVRLGVYDAQGRLVARLLRDVAVAGSLEVRWNGRNLQGERVPPGTYFYRATGPNSVASGRIVVLK